MCEARRLHIGRGLYYSSYKSPRVLVWAIGVIILVLMMAILWPNWEYEHINMTISFALESYIPLCFSKTNVLTTGKMLPMNKTRTKAINRIGPHNKEVLDIIICGMLGDFWADKIPGKSLNSVRFNIEQSISNTAYIHFLSLFFYNLGYCSRPTPTLVKKSDVVLENRFNYRLTLFTFTSFIWLYDSFYKTVNGVTIKIVPFYIADYLTPLGLAHWIMQDGSYQKGQGISIATNSFSYEECKFLATILTDKFGLKTNVIKTGVPNQWRISIWKESMPLLRQLVKPYFIPEMVYKLVGEA